MNIMRDFWQALIRLVSPISALVKKMALAETNREQHAELKKLEVERIDRICNPAKYRGK
ncbi:MAG: hypothetical protein PHY43_15610 [Verrucomicrobiales bacterium]|nr:hypothetical protein [Verrucomicrobiales bacterium]